MEDSHSRVKCFVAALFALGVVALGALVPQAAQAANTCNAFLSIDYPSGPDFALPGDLYRVGLDIGTGSINGGTQMQINRVRFGLDCSAAGSLGIPCTDDGSLIEYEGDGSITTTCSGIVFTTGHGVSDNPNEVVFTPNTPILIAASTPNFCRVEFDVKVLSITDPDPTPTKIEEVAGYQASTFDAQCNNGLQSSGSQSGSINLCPTCTDSACAAFVCNQQTGQCDRDPTNDPAASTSCPDTDQNACTTAGCDGLGNCNQGHIQTVCQPDTNECTDDPACDPGTGRCDHPLTASSTPCTDTDNDACTTAGCDGQGTCNQSHILCVTTTTTTTTSTTTTTLGCQPVPEICDNMIDDDCDGLIDCLDVMGPDPDCLPCPPFKKDPTDIRYLPGLDRLRSKGVLETIPVDLSKVDVGLLLTNPSQVLYQFEMPGSALTASANGRIFRFRNLAARTTGGVYEIKIKAQKDGSAYSVSTISYADLSAAMDPRMRIQFYLGKVVFLSIDTPWKQLPTGWRAPKDH
jgi:hypothetical protein